MSALRDTLAPRILPVLLTNLTTRRPYHDTHLTRPGDAPHDPLVAHPAFGNSFDWHSSAHSHWTATQLLAYFSRSATQPPAFAALQSAVAQNLSVDNIAAETAYLRAYPSYERPYGRAWALLLAAAAGTPHLGEMAQQIANATIDWLNVLPEPIRHGVHSNTAFALGLMLDAAGPLGLDALQRAIAARSRAWFEDDREWPEQWERSGNDFLSPGLVEADLMRRVLSRDAFARWWRAFLPNLSPRSRILAVVSVPDVADGQIVHLHGLNLSRSGALARLARQLDEPLLAESAAALYHASVGNAVAGDYLATHWLATFAWDAAVSIDAR